jgi:hypothetical protein
MTRDETIALFLQGREAWNAWATKMLEERARLEETGQWTANEDDLPGNESSTETRSWIEASTTDFSHCRFAVGATENTANSGRKRERKIFLEAGEIDFSNFIFSGSSDWNGAIFHSHPLLTGGNCSPLRRGSACNKH